jgi:hypothetical protein
MRGLALSPELRAQLQRGTVDVIPEQPTYVGANDLHWNPRPVFQSYAVQTPALDRLNAAHFISAGAPDFVLYGFGAIDSHHPLFDEPATIREVFCRYEVLTREGQLLALRKVAPRCGELSLIEQHTVGWYTDIPVPETQDGLQVALDVRYSWRGELMRLALRAPPVTIGIMYENGARYSYRLVPGLARSGLWIGHLPHDLDGVQALLSGQALPAVRSFRLEGAKADFEPEIRIEFIRLPIHF